MQDKIRSRYVGRDRNVVERRDSEQGFYIGVVRLCLQGVPEKYHDVDLFFRDLGTDLEVAAERAREIPFYVQSRRFRNEFCRCSRAAKREAGENVRILFCPSDHIGLFVIVCDKGDGFLFHFRLRSAVYGRHKVLDL